jgi:nitrogen fixation/metabolism regulation signal transduction histidine kinase
MKNLSLHILDIAHNSIRAKSSKIQIKIIEKKSLDELIISIIDNGSGMTEEQVQALSDPFFTTRTTRRVGLGIPLLQQKAEECNGALLVESKLGEGTTITVNFKHSHIDLPELGDVAGVISGISSSNPHIQFIFDFQSDEIDFHFDTEEIVEALDGIPINTPEVEIFMKEMIEGNLLSD